MSHNPPATSGYLPVTIGTNTSVHPVTLDLAALPHLLIGGMTGSGKTTLLHTIIAPLAAEVSPVRLRYIVYDSKGIDMQEYSALAHMLTPVIHDSKKAILACKWLSKEIDRRYDVLRSVKMKSIQAYHVYVDKKLEELRESGDLREVPEAMPYIILIIDEIAEALHTYPRETEGGLTQLLQRGAPAGVHVIITTSTPSSKLLTPTLRSNIPARIALQVATENDSRTLIGCEDAVELHGVGSALIRTREMKKPLQVNITPPAESHIRRQIAMNMREEEYPPVQIEPPKYHGMDPIFSPMIGDEDPQDELFGTAVSIVRDAGKASTSHLQRKLGIGYARAALLMDMLEKHGVIGPADGAEPREVISKNDE